MQLIKEYIAAILREATGGGRGVRRDPAGATGFRLMVFRKLRGGTERGKVRWSVAEVRASKARRGVRLESPRESRAVVRAETVLEAETVLKVV